MFYPCDEHGTHLMALHQYWRMHITSGIWTLTVFRYASSPSVDGLTAFCLSLTSNS